MNVIVWHESEDQPEIAVTIPAYGSWDVGLGRIATDAELLAAAIHRLPPGVSYEIVGDGTLDALDRYFRPAYRILAGAGVIDMPAARGLHMDNIRRARNAALDRLDIPFLRAVESGNTSEQRRIGTEKQKLRDIPQRFDLRTLYDTPVELKNRWPEGLPK